jgi:Uma2 family endonuclease
MLRQAAPLRSARPRRTLGPQDAGCLLTLEEFERSREQPGFVYELIDGVLIVSPSPVPWHEVWVRIVHQALEDYARKNPRSINFIADTCDVVIARRPGATRPKPDIAAYRNFPDPPPARWDDVCPLIVVEVISERRPRKDTVRNRHLYWSAGGIAEYWIIDPTAGWDHPTLIALSRRPGGTAWYEQVIPFGKSYRSSALPRFTLNLKRASRK